MPIYLLTDDLVFPPPHLAEEGGLLAVGADLSAQRLLLAYRMGIFPWYSEESPILWWSPDPRLVLYPDEFRVSKSLQKIIKQQRFWITLDTAFEQVMTACAYIERPRHEGTWILDEMIQAYCHLHQAGYAHSVEAWYEGELAGGLYGVSLGRCFFGESMFARQNNASKVSLYHLVEYVKSLQFRLIDCQVTTAHLISLGAKEISRRRFLAELEQALRYPTLQGQWRFTTSKGM
jgi:leucyl/phenylalanyl-tRNA--protein transferase